MGLTIKVVKIEDCAINPNPVDINKTFLLSVKVSEIEKVLEPYPFYSNEIYSGEVND